MKYLDSSNAQKNTTVRNLCRVTGCAPRNVRVKSTALDIRTRERVLTQGRPAELIAQPNTEGRTYVLQQRVARIQGRKRRLSRLRRVNA